MIEKKAYIETDRVCGRVCVLRIAPVNCHDYVAFGLLADTQVSSM